MEVEWLAGSGWKVNTPIPFKYGQVAVGFISDGITLPLPILRWVINPQGKGLRAAIIHDWCYKTKIVSRVKADELFKELLIADGVNKVKAYLMYKAVRLFGATYWSM